MEKQVFIQGGKELEFYKKENDNKFSFRFRNDENLTLWILENTKTHRIREDKIHYAIKGIFEKIKEYKPQQCKSINKEDKYYEDRVKQSLLFQINNFLTNKYNYNPTHYWKFPVEEVKDELDLFFNKTSQFVHNINNRKFRDFIISLNIKLDYIRTQENNSYLDPITEGMVKSLKMRYQNLASKVLLNLRYDFFDNPIVEFEDFKIVLLDTTEQVKDVHIFIGILLSIIKEPNHQFKIEVSKKGYQIFYIDRKREDTTKGWIKLDNVEDYYDIK